MRNPAVLLRCYRAFGARYARKTDVLALLFEAAGEQEALQTFADCFDDRGDYAALKAEALRVATSASESEVASSSEPIAVVTRRFLEDVLAEANLPDEIIDVIMNAYGPAGVITMSEDGGRYIVHLARTN